MLLFVGDLNQHIEKKFRKFETIFFTVNINQGLSFFQKY